MIIISGTRGASRSGGRSARQALVSNPPPPGQRTQQMKKQQTLPNYLPAVNRQLEHQAGLLTTSVGSAANGGAAIPALRLWLGTDFTHVIVAR